jgi:integrase
MAQRRPTIPSYRPHSSGQARVTLGGKDVLLGPYGSPESRRAYDRAIAEWLQNKDKPPAAKPDEPPLSVNELLAAYWKHARTYYGWRDKRNGQRSCLKYALRVVKHLYGDKPAVDFGPKSLKACREHMIRKDWSRTYVNAQIDRVRRAFRWAAEEELLPADVHTQLTKVPGLRRGKTESRETKKVRPVRQDAVDATLPFLLPTIRAMVNFQLITGCRPAEVCKVRPLDLDIDMGNPCWLYRPGSDQGPEGEHKTAHYGHERLILIGPQAQAVLRPFLGTKLDGYCFSPAASEAERSTKRRQQRKTPMTPSQTARKPKKNRKRPVQDRYDVTSYRNAVYRACDKAFPPPAPLACTEDETRKEWQARLTPEQKQELRAWQKEHRWHPNRLRHSRATELRKHGLDVTKTVLGHTKVETSQIYAERDIKAAMELVARIG